MAKFVILSGPDAGNIFELDGPEITIGRQQGVEIKLAGTNVSRRHARVIRDPVGFLLEDLQSSNGTFLNGVKLSSRTPLKPRDEIRIGSYVLRFDGPGGAELTIRARTVANTGNLDLFKENAGQKLRIILDLAHQLGRSLDPEYLLITLTQHLFALFAQAERALTIFMENGSPVVRLSQARGGTSAPAQYSTSILNQVLAEGIGVVAEDIQSDARFAEAQSICSLGVRSFMCVPLKQKDGTIFGMLQLDRFGQGSRFNQEDLHLFTAIGLQVAVVIENARLHQEVVAKQRMERDLALAREIQISYLPTILPQLANSSFELHAELSPAYEVSGDFYDYFSLGNDRLGLVVADVSGKGMPAALFMSSARVLLRQVAKPDRDPGEILLALNNALAEDNPKCLFITVLLAVYCPATGKVVLASGGHPPPLLRQADGSVRCVQEASGNLLGFHSSSKPLSTTELQLAPGDSLLCYTDGVTEATRGGKEMFGLNRLIDCLQSAKGGARLSEWASLVRGAVQEFTGEVQQEDDITLALLRRNLT